MPFMLGYAGQKRDEPRGLDAKGWNAQDRFYKASDRWFYLAAPGPDGRGRLMRAAGVAPGSADLESTLAARFTTAPAAFWVKRLNATGIGAHVAAKFNDVLTDETAERRRLVLRWNENGKELRSLGLVSRLSLTQPIPGKPAAARRAHSRASCRDWIG
jgi:crotonobetainyl-CoA:carnitine CoA-transferase CaiB-like acyl-CoA transferase